MNNLSRGKRYLFSILTGLLLGVAWPFTGGVYPLLFVALVPLLMVEHYVWINQSKVRAGAMFSQAYVAFFVFNVVSSWWIYYASFSGMLMEMLLNSLFMAVVFWLFHRTKRKLGPRQGVLALVMYWIGFEYMHLWWDFSYPWLNLGNGFATAPYLIQWYDITGVAGGTLWILAINLLITRVVMRRMVLKQPLKKQRGVIVAGVLTLLVPSLYSTIVYVSHEDVGEQVEVVVVQPNIDPYNDKFTKDPIDQLHEMLALAEEKITPKTEYLAFPETALQENALCAPARDGFVYMGLWEHQLEESQSVGVIRAFMEEHPQLKIVMGMSSKKVYPKGLRPTDTSRELGETGVYYDSYNSAMYLDASDSISVYYKSKPLIGVERMPFTWIMKHFEELIWDMGGTTGSLGVQENRETFTSKGHPANVAPVICYESVFGEFVGDFVKEGANVIFIITNDGWWDNTPGHRQHNAYASLRAIEHRRSIARSANTGISCFVNQRGDILQPTDWWVPTAIRGNVSLNEELTFYSRFGDYIGRTAFWIACMMFLYTIVVHMRTRVDPLAN